METSRYITKHDDSTYLTLPGYEMRVPKGVEVDDIFAGRVYYAYYAAYIKNEISESDVDSLGYYGVLDRLKVVK